MQHDLVCDTECYPNFWSIGFLRPSDGKLLVFEHSVRKPLTDRERERIRNIMLQNRIIGYNFQNYDAPMIAVMLDGADNARLKQANDRIIVGKMKHWHSEDVLGVVVPRAWHILDLMEPQPNAFASLKTLAGRMHAPKMQDLPYSPDTALSEAEMDEVLSYMGNDLEVTSMLFDALREPLALRKAMGEKYGVDIMSKSDAQAGEAILKKCVERETGKRAYKVETPSGTTFSYKPPDYIRFESDLLKGIFERIKRHEFMVRRTDKGQLKVELPDFLADTLLHIGGSAYQMGIGGLHSTEKNRAVHSDDEHCLVDLDVASYYPRTTLNSGLYPRSLGKAFLTVYRGLTDGRVTAKNFAKALAKLEKAGAITAEQVEQMNAAKAEADGVKIFVNGGGFGKLGSEYSILFAPHLLIHITLTGQLAILMLIERAEAAGISVVSANTDGVVFRIPRHMMGPIKDDRITSGSVASLVEKWESDTGFDLEAVPYRAIYNSSVNDYIAIKDDGSVKWKGVVANPWRASKGFKPDIRAQLMKNPQMPIIANAVVDLILHDIPIEETIRAGTDIREFVTVIKVEGGATWRDGYLGKVVRFIWSTDGEVILRAQPNSKGTHAQVPKSEGARPVMELPDHLPVDIDYDAYISAAREVLMNIGYHQRPPAIRPIRIYKWSAPAWFALAAA